MSGYIDLSTVSTFGTWKGDPSDFPIATGTSEVPEVPMGLELGSNEREPDNATESSPPNDELEEELHRYAL